MGNHSKCTISITPPDIKDVFRINSKPSNNTLIVEFTFIIMKERFLSGLRQFNKKHNDGGLLSTHHLKTDGPKLQIFVSENLSKKNHFYLAREFKKTHKYKYRWTSFRRIYLLQDDGSPLI
ncbi:unnamed protein product [Diatraea saccharalis]|uniref:Uncharacterized protein n=1 Tax=Diatraea saccharalis TaxID=40085 RepID=A0A9N9R844_9NEOP|nr:unnamed protein product [Diatraea saccharalis]